MPMRQIERTYTKSELGIMAWRSGEIASNMQLNRAPAPGFQLPNMQPSMKQDAQMDAIEEQLGPIAAKLNDELDMRKLTGEEVLRYMQTFGIYIPHMPSTMGKPRDRTIIMGIDPVEAHRNIGVN